MLMKRCWAKDIEVHDGWAAPCKVAKHRIYAYWSHPEVIPCDEMGIRIPSGFNSFKEKYQKSKGQRIFCFGGSTTMGWFCGYHDSYPHCMEGLLGDVSVFNFGLGGSDSRGAMDLFIDLYRLGYRPDLAIFLDGVNEKQGWFQALNGFESYEETSSHYGYFDTLIIRHQLPMAGGWKEKNSFVNKIKKIFNRTGEKNKDIDAAWDPLKFTVEQSQYYAKTNRVIREIAAAWNIPVKFFLQPVLWDVWKEGADPRYEYMKSLYKGICRGKGDVIDLSKRVAVKAYDFIDWQHLSAAGNKILAQVIAKELKI